MNEIMEKIDKAVDELKSNKNLLDQFDKEPVKVIEKLVGMDLPDDQVEKVIDAIKAKLKVDDLGDVLGLVGKLFK
ncbi:MAG: hypothetical protein IJF53_07005 [Clostridia bacterium]|nr:hypothetical protein [Clostridia bacterium]MBQ3063078.1 hypothetical protein [Clostridia bacterium]